ncbi:alpha/beta hydrolase [Microtetraspora sp. AC03309]|uniref:alpha/beta hydrolase family protein n=1 Tax=Microtetraspora sp. AC03309 TaxID=2779376 RepID=UPI001E620625|nr:alpha/beta hydrolase [Microtetraspora sp. AC03309]MCC5575786.1 alpha/beta hydrolase [Microtetraspora sp. AC03309]
MTRSLTAVLLLLAASACSTPAAPRSDPAASPSVSVTPGTPTTLPAPTGEHAVGTSVLYLKDTSRPDPWNLDVSVRELKVTLWYPTRQKGGQRAPYMTAKESELLLKGGRIAGVPYDVLSKTRTNAVRDAEPEGRKLPLVVLSPGFTKPVSTLTSLAEELASRGYLVAGIDHPYESYATTLADGTVAECLACDSDRDPGFGPRVTQIRSADVSFVLDSLGKWPVDRARIAMVGQSIGGASAVAAMVTDSRIRAAINMDGTTYARIPKGGFTKPVMFMGSPGHVPGGGDASWDRDWKLLTGWKRWIMLTGSEHASFTDTPLMAATLGVKPVYGVLTGARGSELTRTYVAAFLDQHLKSQRQPLLGKPSSRYPEVTFCPATCGQS